MKDILLGKEEIKLSPFSDNMIGIYRKKATKKLLEWRNEFSKAARYKTNIQKAEVLLYSNNKLSENINQGSNVMNIYNKYLKINLIKEVKDFHNGNFETLMKEIEDDVKKWMYECTD